MQKVSLLLLLLGVFICECSLATDNELEARIRYMVRNEIEVKLFEASQDKASVCSAQNITKYLNKEIDLLENTYRYWLQSVDMFSIGKIEIFKIQLKKQCCLMTGKLNK